MYWAFVGPSHFLGRVRLYPSQTPPCDPSVPHTLGDVGIAYCRLLYYYIYILYIFIYECNFFCKLVVHIISWRWESNLQPVGNAASEISHSNLCYTVHVRK